MVEVKTAAELDKIRESCQIITKVFEKLKGAVKAGVSLLDLDHLVDSTIRAEGAIPAFIGYRGYRHATCLSLNSEVVHGIPNDRILADGDILGIDVGTKKDGYFGDAAYTFPVGSVDKKAQKLLKAGEETMWLAIKQARAGNHVGDISSAIERNAKKHGYSIVRTLYGHGVGKALHEDPLIPNFGNPGTGPLLKAGMVLAIEPMLNLGTGDVETLDDGWTVVTADRKLSVHFERTILVTNGEPEVLTKFYGR
jgi:methionyl aminopeptidase